MQSSYDNGDANGSRYFCLLNHLWRKPPQTDAPPVGKDAEEQCAASPEFKAAYEEECAILALVRARNAAEMTQKDVADALKVSQSYIARVERGSKPMRLSLMIR